jgi:hypothetical protein
MAAGMTIMCGVDFIPDYMDYGEDCPPVISTLPMPVLMERLNYECRPEFRYSSGTNIRATVRGADAYCSVMVCDPRDPISRVSITGDEIIAEVPRVAGESAPDPIETAERAADILGIGPDVITDVRVYDQTYQKIIPIDDEERKRFIAWATDKHNVYSLGRYATWRPTLQLDDLVRDIRHIESWINGGGYEVRQHRVGGGR